MTKKIILSLSIIGIVAAMAVGGTIAYFSDTETTTGNAFIAGTIDLTVEGKSETLPFTLDDMKPGYEQVVTKKIVVESNPSNVWMKIKDFVTDTGEQNESECEAERGKWQLQNEECINMDAERNDLHNQIFYDLSVCIDNDDNGTCDYHQEDVIYSFDEKDLETLASLNSKWIPLKMNLSPGTPLLVMQSFHFNEEAGNKYQGDELTFSEEFIAYQKEATSPTGNVLYMENKNLDNWKAKYGDEMEGKLTYNSSGSTFDYTFEATGLDHNGDYKLIYYADNVSDGWPGNSPGALIANFNADNNGDIVEISGSVDLGINMPDAADYNYPAGAKIWLVLASDYNLSSPGTPGKMTGWNPDKYLFENNPTLIHYQDTDL